MTRGGRTIGTPRPVFNAEVQACMDAVAESYGLRVVHGFCDPESEIKAALQSVMDEDAWDWGKGEDEWGNNNQMAPKYFNDQIIKHETFAVVAYDKNNDDHPCCLLSVQFRGRRGAPQGATYTLLWTQKEYRRKGYALFLTCYFSQFLEEGGQLDSGTYDRPSMIAFYQKHNWTESKKGSKLFSIPATQLQAQAIALSQTVTGGAKKEEEAKPKSSAKKEQPKKKARNVKAKASK